MRERLKRLDEIKEKLQRGTRISPVTIQEFLSWFGVQRRQAGIVWWIKRNLEGRGLGTEPDFESAYIGSQIKFFLTKTATRGTDAVTNFGSADPTYRISRLKAANNNRCSPESKLPIIRAPAPGRSGSGARYWSEDSCLTGGH
jgi:hypothetical protein